MHRNLVILLGGLAVASCNTDPNPAATPEGGADTAAADTAMPDIPPPTPDEASATTPQQFVEDVASSDMFEIEAAKLAQKSGKSQATKDFAAMMVKDHTASTAKLMEAAKKASPAITAKPALTSEQKAMIDALKGAGPDFDKRYAEQQVAAHDKALGLLKTYAASGSDVGLKAFASAAVPTVQAHADKAKALPAG